ncbi:hypothetical protein [Marinifilum sp. D714]|uniref:hypothetical protein n=1 Tax=Marinifilum sp. D714 TaxID=2937523 RepID=UPI0027C73932|nr:hypothetical protein [Marinifilum sp. D714]MDQ2177961.1 hypothetical protein [Marinifilum sp. D714]
MDISLVTEYSLWWILPIFLLSIAIVYRLYFYKQILIKEIAVWKTTTLAGLRFFVVFLLLFLLIGPRIKYQKRIKNKPVLIVAQDNSMSLKLGQDSSYYLNQYHKDLHELIASLQDDYEVRSLSFGEKVSALSELDFNEPSTDYSSLFQFVKDNYGSVGNVQMLLASDGLYNSGANPRYLSSDIGMPIHTIQLGDTLEINDVSIYSIKSNRIGFTNTKLPVKVGIKALNFKNKKLFVEIRNKTKLLLQDEINVAGENFYLEKDYLLDAEQKGLQRYSVKVSSAFPEYTLKNNTADFVVDVLDSKRKIVIAFDQYHPDIAAIKSAILENFNFDCELLNLSQKQVSFEETNLIVLYQIPSKRKNYQDLFKQIELAKIPTLIVVGASSDLNSLNSLNLGVRLNSENEYYQDAVYMGNQNFSLFNLQSKEKNVFEKLPPIRTPFGDIKLNNESQILAYQKIKGVDTQYPLIAFGSVQDRKMGWIFGEGMWRWKLNEFQLFDSNNHFNDFVNRTIQYLALKVKKDQLIIRHDKDYAEGNQVKIQAELYNDSYELINKLDLQFVLTNEDGKTYNYQFSRKENDYDLTINSLKNGRYNYKVQTVGLSKNLVRSGEFIVRSNTIESKRLQAETITLKQISESTNGIYFGSFDSKKIKTHFQNDKYIKPTISYESNYGNAVSLIYLLSFIIILMILEWFLRKYWLGN